ncbi:LamB/YcsF family protein [Roseateles sp. DB2]|uniref:LamB/YcsF family protein n=1 Tax=Roseateles sp. DB2 TaxID=3453717 RepID=UPI003EEE328F
MSSTPPRTALDLNADLGEGCADEALILPWISSANIACGGHTGDADSMRASIARALDSGVAVGAHPSYADPAHFGRQPQAVTAGLLASLRGELARQLQDFQRAAQREGARPRHVKPHGALYNQAAQDPQLTALLLDLLPREAPGLALVALAGSPLAQAARRAGLPVREEGFADRRYTASATLLPRSEPGAVLEALADGVAQGLALALGEPVQAHEGSALRLHIDTLCVHGDGLAALPLVRALHESLRAAGLALRAPD